MRPLGAEHFSQVETDIFFNLLGLGSRLPLAPCRPLVALRCFAACCLSPAACASELRETAAENATSDANKNPTIATKKGQEANKIRQDEEGGKRNKPKAAKAQPKLWAAMRLQKTLAAARKQAASREILLWMTPSEAPKALQASECSELLDPMRASCWISAQH